MISRGSSGTNGAGRWPAAALASSAHVAHWTRRLSVAVWLLFGAAPAGAHPGSVAFWHVVVEGREFRSRIIVSLEDVGWPGGPGADEAADVATLQQAAARVTEHFTVGADTIGRVRVESTRVVEPGSLEVVAVGALADAGAALTLRTTFHQMTAPDHRVVARVERGGESVPLVLHAGVPDHVLPALAIGESLAGATDAGSFPAMVRLGVAHILTGYDHLLFLACLLLPGGTWRSRALVVTAFTAAHSLTLGLAALRVVTLPERFVETAIALSIAYVALENVLGDRARPRWPAAFGFGLIHGFGFAGMLDVLHLPTGQWLWAVLAFNAGVELGQLAIAAVAVPLLAMLARHAWHGRAVQLASAGVFGLAVFWIMERLS